LRSDLVLLILSHGRPDLTRDATARSMLASGYTGPWYVVLDSEDLSREEYEAEFGPERIIIFDKDDDAQDLGDNGGPRGAVVYARNQAARIARELGFAYYMQLDDDYRGWYRRFPAEVEGKMILTHRKTHHLDDVLDAMVTFLEDTGAHTVAFAQGGDLIGGLASTNYRRGLLRKAMNTFIARTEDPVHFVGRINEDVNTYVTQSMTGKLFLTYVDFQVIQPKTQKSEGGLTDAYLALGTYWKSFYTVMMAPSAVTIATMGVTGYRIHHSVRWEHVAPKILSERWRKPR
jgi:hypothetical protein